MSSACDTIASSALEREHRSVDTVVEAISAVADDLEQGRQVDPSLLGEVILFLRIFADQCQAGSKNGGLTPELEAKCKAGSEVARGIVEHSQRCQCQVGEVLA